MPLSSPHHVFSFSRGVIFTLGRVSLALQSLRKLVGTTCSLASQQQGTIYSSLTIARKYKIFHSFLEHGLFFFGGLHIVVCGRSPWAPVCGQLYAGSRRLCSSLPRDASVKAEETESGKPRTWKVPGNQDRLIVLHSANFVKRSE